MKKVFFIACVCCTLSVQAQVDSLVKVIESRTDSTNALRAYLAAMGGTTSDAVAQFNT